MSEIFTIILLALLSILVIVLIILGIKLIAILNKADDMLNDIDFRNHLDTLFLKYVDEYIKDMTLRNGD